VLSWLEIAHRFKNAIRFIWNHLKESGWKIFEAVDCPEICFRVAIEAELLETIRSRSDPDTRCLV